MKKLSKILSVVLVLAMIMGMAAVVSAEETATYTQVSVSKAEDITAGKYLIYGVAGSATDDGSTTAFMTNESDSSNRLKSTQLTISDGTVTTAETSCVWELVDAEGGFYLKSADGKYVSSATVKKAKLVSSTAEATILKVVNSGNGWTLQSTSSDSRLLTANRFGSAGSYYIGFAFYASVSQSCPCTLTFYKLNETTGGDDNTSGGEETPSDVVSISTALAATEGTFNVSGAVTLIDGKNIYIQDATGGICAYFSEAPADLALGDVITVSGTRAAYNGLPELTGAIWDGTKTSSTLTPKAVTIADLTTNDICTYVKLTGLTVIEVYDNNGSYSAPNITVTDGTNNIQLYKAVVGKTGDEWDVKVGDVLDVCAAVGVYQKNNTGTETLQLRNTLASQITVVTSSEDDEGGSGENEGTGSGDTAAYTKVTDGELTSGKYILVDDNGYAPTVLEGNWLQSVLPTIGEDGTVTDSKGAVLTLTVDGSTVKIADANGVVIYNTGNGAKLYEDDTAWTWQYADGKFTFNDGGNDEGKIRYLGTSAKFDFKLRAYYQLEEPDSYGNFYYTYFTLYKLTGTDSGSTGSGTGSDSGSTDTGSGSGSSSDTGSTTTPEKPVETVKAPAVVASPVAGTAYKFGYYQANKDKTLWITGEMAGYYMATTDKWSEAADVYTETTDGGVYLYFMSGTTKTYINLVKNGNYTNFDLSATAATVYTYNTQYKYFSAKVGEDTVYLGTYKDYETMSASNVSYIEDASVIGKSQFLACMYEMTDVPAGSGSNPDTGDTTISLVVAALVVSALGMTAMVAKKKEF